MAEDDGRTRAAEERQGPAEVLDPAQAELLRQRLLGQQSLPRAVLAGVGASLLGAGLWAAVTVATGYQLGLMAVALGFGVGLAVRAAGKGITTPFGVAGAALALAGCALGNLLAVVALVASGEGVPFFEALARLDLDLARRLVVAGFRPMDLLFYGVAVYEGYRLSFRSVDADEARRILEGGATG